MKIALGHDSRAVEDFGLCKIAIELRLDIPMRLRQRTLREVATEAREVFVNARGV